MKKRKTPKRKAKSPKRKKTAARRSPRKKKRGKKGKRAAVFSRAKPPFNPPKEINKTAWQDWARARQPRPDAWQPNKRHVRSMLARRDVDESVIDDIMLMVPELHYVVRIYGRRGSRDNEAMGVGGEDPILQATFFGETSRLWSRLIGYASHAPIDGLAIDEILQIENDGPLWGQKSVVTVDGRRIYGHGNREEYRDRLKAGRPKKSGGGMSAPERRKNDRNKSAALKRRAEFNDKYEALRKTDPAAAARMRERSMTRRKWKV